MSIECDYSFSDLYLAAYGKKPSAGFQNKFMAMTQKARNELVKDWVKRAKWETRERKGTDGQMYLAFAPRF